jgi:ribosomal protein L9
MPDGAIRVVGTYELVIALHADVDATITLDVKAA